MDDVVFILQVKRSERGLVLSFADGGGVPSLGDEEERESLFSSPPPEPSVPPPTPVFSALSALLSMDLE